MNDTLKLVQVYIITVQGKFKKIIVELSNQVSAWFNWHIAIWTNIN